MQTYPCGENAEWLSCLLLYILLAVKYEATNCICQIFKDKARGDLVYPVVLSLRSPRMSMYFYYWIHRFL